MKAFQFHGMNSLHKIVCLFCIIASEITEKFEQSEWKVSEPALLFHQIHIFVQEAKNWGDFFSAVNLNTVNFRFIKHRLEIKQRA